jgi:hypothetical protein
MAARAGATNDSDTNHAATARRPVLTVNSTNRRTTRVDACIDELAGVVSVDMARLRAVIVFDSRRLGIARIGRTDSENT